MPHQQTWLIKNHVVAVTFSGELTAEDIGNAFHESAQHVIESSDAPVHFLHDWRNVERFPTSLSQVFKASQNSKAPLSKVGWVVAYGKYNKLFKFMGDIFFQLFNVRFRLCETREEAVDFLCQQDQRLDKNAFSAEKSEVATEAANS